MKRASFMGETTLEKARRFHDGQYAVSNPEWRRLVGDLLEMIPAASPGMRALASVGQRRLHSFMEACVNCLVGYSIAVAANFAVLPLFGFRVTMSDSLLIGLIMTVISIARSYALRRAFNWWHEHE